MTRRRRILISAGIVAACICAAWGVIAMLPPGPGVTKANFDRIEKGMTKPEVVGIIGSPTDKSPNGLNSPLKKAS